MQRANTCHATGSSPVMTKLDMPSLCCGFGDKARARSSAGRISGCNEAVRVEIARDRAYAMGARGLSRRRRSMTSLEAAIAR